MEGTCTASQLSYEGKVKKLFESMEKDKKLAAFLKVEAQVAECLAAAVASRTNLVVDAKLCARSEGDDSDWARGG